MQDTGKHQKIRSTSRRQRFAAVGIVLASSSGGGALANPTYQVLYAFTGLADGSSPAGQRTFDPWGNLIGTTTNGGLFTGVAAPAGNGTVYKISPNRKFSVVYAFKGTTDGSEALAGVISDVWGNVYGTTQFGGTAGGVGGTFGNGTVYQVTPSGQLSVLYSFKGGADGSSPLAPLSPDVFGNINGTALFGGNTSNATCIADGPPFGCGTVFKISPWGQYSVRYTFTGESGVDGSNPWDGLISDTWGNVYGTTFGGGLPGVSNVGNGTVFKVTPSGTENVLYEFTGYADGSSPYASLIGDNQGNLYGTTSGGGVEYALSGYGVVFKLEPNGHEVVLHTFTGGSDGGVPYAGLIGDCSGNVYGAATSGGIVNGGAGGAAGNGVVFKITANGTYKVLYSFNGGTDGANPFSTLIADQSGNLYGTATLGGIVGGPTGQSGNGVVYKVSGAGFDTSCW